MLPVQQKMLINLQINPMQKSQSQKALAPLSQQGETAFLGHPLFSNKLLLV